MVVELYSITNFDICKIYDDVEDVVDSLGGEFFTVFTSNMIICFER